MRLIPQGTELNLAGNARTRQENGSPLPAVAEWGLALVAFALLALLGWKAGHHWDEYFYLYSSYLHSPAELIRYELASAVFPAGFFTGKIGHVVLLHLLTGLFGAGERVLYALEIGYLLLLLGYFWASYRLLLELFGAAEARDSTLVLMFSPVALYLVFKLLSEVPSLLLVSLAGWAFVRSFAARSQRSRRWALALTVPLLTLGALFRVTGVVGFAGLGLGLLLSGDPRFPRKQVVGALILTGTVAGALYSLLLYALGGSVFRVFSSVHTVATTHPPLERAFALACFVQTFALALPFAWKRRHQRSVKLAAVWLACAAVPFLVGHEPRYYAPALVPLAMLTSSGLRVAAAKLTRLEPRTAWLALLAVLVLVNRAFFIPLMPYEVEQGRLLALFHQISEQSPDATYLLPWISDYSLLRFSFPRSRIDLCLSVLPGGRVSSPGHTGELGAADRWWAGSDHYVGSRAVLLQQPLPWKYLGWTYNPADLELLHLLERLGLPAPSGGKLHNHLAGSWIWLDKSLSLRLAKRSGMYYLYDLEPESAAP
jgi:hypothetical protein